MNGISWDRSLEDNASNVNAGYGKITANRSEQPSGAAIRLVLCYSAVRPVA
jgi:hypothetical protein